MSTKYHYDILQGTDEWLEIRRGILTSSNVKLILTPKLKVSENEKTRSLAYELAAQRISGIVEESYSSSDMERGHIEEEIARDIYSERYAKVTECGFITNDSLGFVLGSSPDGLIGEDGMIEIKSRIQKHQIKTIFDNEAPDEYMLQMQTSLMLTGRKWCDFISFSNGLPMFVKRVEPMEDYFKAIAESAVLFEKSIREVVDRYEINSKEFFKHERVEHIGEIV